LTMGSSTTWSFRALAYELRLLRLGRPIVEGFAAVLVGAALFLAIMSFGWPTRGGHQCWKTGFPAMIRRGHSPN
jgi:hypothetical protein